jgi:hypothetical protein
MNLSDFSCLDGHKHNLYIYYEAFSNKSITSKTMHCFQCDVTKNGDHTYGDNYISHMNYLYCLFSKCDHKIIRKKENISIISKNLRSTYCLECKLNFVWETEYLKGICFKHDEYDLRIYQNANYYCNVYSLENKNNNGDDNNNNKLYLEDKSPIFTRCRLCDDLQIYFNNELMVKEDIQKKYNSIGIENMKNCNHILMDSNTQTQLYLDDIELIKLNISINGSGIFNNNLVFNIKECLICGLRFIIYNNIIKEDTLGYCSICKRVIVNNNDEKKRNIKVKCSCNEYNNTGKVTLCCNNCDNIVYKCHCKKPSINLKLLSLCK